jgi:hypothetical protein
MAAPLTRATSANTRLNLGTLEDWLRVRVDKWAKAPISVPEASEGHALVFRICTESGQPRDAQQKCYELFIDYARAVCSKFGSAPTQREQILGGLFKVFKYLDQHYTNTKKRSTPKARHLPHSWLLDSRRKRLLLPSWRTTHGSLIIISPWTALSRTRLV